MEGKRKIKKTLLVITMILLLTLSFICVNTFAKYISKIYGKGISEVAKWSFKVNGQTSTISQIKLINTADSTTIENGKIAPGTNGGFDLNIDATGTEVDTKYSVKFENETRKPQNLKYVYNGETYSNLSDLGAVLEGIISTSDENKEKDIHIDWKWDFETDSQDSDVIAQYDLTDTNDAQELSEYSFDIIILGTQVEN